MIPPAPGDTFPLHQYHRPFPFRLRHLPRQTAARGDHMYVHCCEGGRDYFPFCSKLSLLCRLLLLWNQGPPSRALHPEGSGLEPQLPQPHQADQYNVRTRTITKCLMEIQCLEWRLIFAPPSILAAALVWLARLILGGEEWVHLRLSGAQIATELLVDPQPSALLILS